MRKTKHVVHYNIYKASIDAFNVEPGKARQTFFSNIFKKKKPETETTRALILLL